MKINNKKDEEDSSTRESPRNTPSGDDPKGVHGEDLERENLNGNIVDKGMQSSLISNGNGTNNHQLQETSIEIEGEEEEESEGSNIPNRESADLGKETKEENGSFSNILGDNFEGKEKTFTEEEGLERCEGRRGEESASVEMPKVCIENGSADFGNKSSDGKKEEADQIPNEDSSFCQVGLNNKENGIEAVAGKLNSPNKQKDKSNCFLQGIGSSPRNEVEAIEQPRPKLFIPLSRKKLETVAYSERKVSRESAFSCSYTEKEKEKLNSPESTRVIQPIQICQNSLINKDSLFAKVNSNNNIINNKDLLGIETSTVFNADNDNGSSVKIPNSISSAISSPHHSENKRHLNTEKETEVVSPIFYNSLASSIFVDKRELREDKVQPHKIGSFTETSPESKDRHQENPSSHIIKILNPQSILLDKTGLETEYNPVKEEKDSLNQCLPLQECSSSDNNDDEGDSLANSDIAKSQPGKKKFDKKNRKSQFQQESNNSETQSYMNLYTQSPCNRSHQSNISSYDMTPKSPIKANDIIEVVNQKDSTLRKARVMRVEENLEESFQEESIEVNKSNIFNKRALTEEDNSKKFYVHFLNYEKRMDNWIPAELVIRKIGAQGQQSQNGLLKLQKMPSGGGKNAHISNFGFGPEPPSNSMLTRKRSNLNAKEEIHDSHFEFNSKIKNIEKIIIGQYDIETWYYSPFPSQVTKNKVLFICEFCLKYMALKETLCEHLKTCPHIPPGKEIYKMDLGPKSASSDFAKNKGLVVSNNGNKKRSSNIGGSNTSISMKKEIEKNAGRSNEQSLAINDKENAVSFGALKISGRPSNLEEMNRDKKVPLHEANERNQNKLSQQKRLDLTIAIPNDRYNHPSNHLNTDLSAHINQSNQANIATKSLSIYEVKGSENKLYCQNLSLLSKLFLDHKSIYFDVSPFMFYIITENNDIGSHFVGYFSKELSPLSEYNLACIMVLPPYQKSGYGQFLIALSYYISKQENKIGTPEVPLSDLGRLSYKSYWTIVLLEVLVKSKCNVTLRELSECTHIKYEDVVYTLNELNLIKYWRGQQVLQSVNQKQLEEFLKKKKSQKAHHIKFSSEYFV